MKRYALLAVILFPAVGCGQMLGVEKHYVLREQVAVHIEGGTGLVTLPAGTHVKQTFAKGGTALIELQGEASEQKLEESTKEK